MSVTPVDEAFAYRVESDLKYSPTFLFWWHYSEIRARLGEARRLFRPTSAKVGD